MIITQLIEYFRESANRHRDVACYRTGESYEFNESGISYPLLFLHTDIITSFDSNGGLLNEEYIYFTFRLSVLTLSKEGYDYRPDNEIKLINTTTKQNQDLDLTHRIMSQIVAKAIKDFNENFVNGWMLTSDNNGASVKRVNNDDCDGWYIELTVKAHNELYCDHQDAFGDDVIDKSNNKTEYQSPINVNPIQP